MAEHLYEIQHFGFSAEQISLERHYLLKQILELLLQGVLKKMGLLKNTPSSEEKKTELVWKILGAFRSKMQEIESCDKKNFTIPPFVLLSQDYEHTKELTVNDLERLDAEVSHLKKIFLENSIMIAALEMENSQYEQIKDFVFEEQEVQQQLQESFDIYEKNRKCSIGINTDSTN